MNRDHQWSPNRRRVLRLLLEADHPLWSVQMAQATGVPHGSVYEVVRRLRTLEWVTATPEENPPGRPARLLYRLTERGRTEIATLLGADEEGT